MTVRNLVALAGAALIAGSFIVAAGHDRSDAALGTVIGLAAGLLLALAVAAWRRSWQRFRPHRGAWGRLAWVCFWLGALAIGFVVVIWDAVLLIPPALGTLFLCSAFLPSPSSIVGPPRFVEDWARVESVAGRLSHDGVSLALPPGWTAWRIPESGGSPEALVLVPDERRWDLPIPVIGFVRLIGEAGPSATTSEALVEQLRAGLGKDLPIEITHLSSGAAFVVGETAVTVDAAAKLRDDEIPIPGPLMAVGRAVFGIRPVAGRLYLIDRAGERWAIGWLAWADGQVEVEEIGDRILESVRWHGP